MNELNQLLDRFIEAIADRVASRLANKQEEPAVVIDVSEAEPAETPTPEKKRADWFSNSGRHHLSEDGVAHLKRRIREGAPDSEIASEMGISPTAVYYRRTSFATKRRGAQVGRNA